MTISATWTWRLAGSSKVEEMTSPFTLALHVGDFLGPLVDQQDDQEHFGMVVGDRLGDVLQQHGLAGARRRDDQRALALALRRDDVDDPRRLVLDCVGSALSSVSFSSG